MLQARHAGRPGRRRVRAGRRICRGGAHHQRAVLPPCRGADGRVPGAGRDHRRRRLWRQFLRHRRAAEELPRHGRSFGRRADRAGARCVRAAAQREVRASCIPRTRRSTGCRHMLWTGAPTQTRGRMPATPSSTATRRSTARPAAPAPRRAWRSWHAKGRLKVGDDFVHESIIGSLFKGRVESDADGGGHAGHHPLDRRLGAHDRATTRSSSTTAIRSRTAFR